MNNFNSKNLITFFFLSIIFFFFFNLYFGYLQKFYLSHGDSAFFVDLIDELGKTNKYDSSIHRSHLYIFPYLLAEPQDYCLFKLHDANYVPNMLIHGHTYFIIYLIAIFVKLGLPALEVSSFLFAASYALILYSIFNFLKNKINIFVVILFVVTIISWAPLSVGFAGQFYFDRLFILPMMLIIFLYYDYFKENKKNNIIKIILLSILTCLLHERAFLMVGFFLVSYSLLMTNFKFYKDKNVLTILLLGLFLIFLYFLYTKTIQDSYYAPNTTVTQMKANFFNLFTNDLYGKQSLKLFFIVLPLMIISLKNKRLFLIACISILPQFLVTVGGAEKNLLISHYHAFYIPYVVAAAVISFYEYYKAGKKINKIIIFCLLPIIIIFNSYYDYANVENTFSFTKKDNGRIDFFRSVTHIFQTKRNEHYYENIILKKMKIREQISENSSISAPEHFMPYLSTYNVKVDVFPVGIGLNDYVFLTSYNKNDIYSMSVPSFKGANEKKLIADCMKAKLQNKYNIVSSEIFLDGSIITLFKIK